MKFFKNLKFKKKFRLLCVYAALLYTMYYSGSSLAATDTITSLQGTASQSIASQATQKIQEPNLTAQSAILIDSKTGQVLYAKNPDERHYPASITKILTAILALEHSKLTDQVKTSKLATEQDGNRVYLVNGEQESMEQMLYGLMLNSGNDAAIAIAEHVASSVPAFADMMNAKAKQIGATNSHFVTPNGLHDPNHYTTAHDMALIARYAMRIPEFRKLVSTKYYPWHGQEWDSTLVNLNRLLWTYKGATGIKTGFTDQAQQTAVISATRGNTSLLTVLLDIQGLQEARKESASILDYGFANFYSAKLADKGQEITTLQVQGDTNISIVTAKDTWADERNGVTTELYKTYKLRSLEPPIKAGTDAGVLEFWNGKTLIAQTPLVVAKDVPLLPATPWYWDGSYAAVGLLLLLAASLGVFRLQKKKQQNQQMNEI